MPRPLAKLSTAFLSTARKRSPSAPERPGGVAARIADENQGELQYFSATDTGTKVRFSLPLSVENEVEMRGAARAALGE